MKITISLNRFLSKLSDWYFSREALPYWCVLALDCAIVVLSNLFVYALLYGVQRSVDNFGLLLGTLLLYLGFYLVGFKMMRTYSGVLRYSSFLDLARIGFAMFVSFALIMLARSLVNLDTYLHTVGGQVLIMGAMLSTLLMWFVRVAVKFMYDAFFGVSRQKSVFIYGVREGGISLAKSIRNEKPSRYRLRGFCSDNPNDIGKHLMGKRVYKTDASLITAMRRERAKILLVSPLKSEMFCENIPLQLLLSEAGIKIYMIPALEEWDSTRKLTHTQLKEVDIVDLLPREQIDIDTNVIEQQLTDTSILITGSAGSIGSEMVRQIAGYKPKRLVLIDTAETPQHDIRLMMQRDFPDIEAHTIVTSICNEERMDQVFGAFRPDYVFHAAAYKHVPMMEDNPSEAVFNNIRGTQILAHKAVKYGVKKFVMISTDKAVNPTNVMGCSKRICEMDVQSIDGKIKELYQSAAMGQSVENPFELAPDVERPVTQFVTTRFGNVLGSNGSVIPLFREQIKKGGPVTVTHPDIVRFFMLIPEACRLVLEAGTMGHGGEIFVFDMGSPVKIVDLAKRMIQLSGNKDIEIKFTGLRDGEKLYEEVLADKEHTKPTCHPKIMVAAVRYADYAAVSEQLKQLYALAQTFDDMAIVKMMKEMVPEFKSRHSKYEVLD